MVLLNYIGTKGTVFKKFLDSERNEENIKTNVKKTNIKCFVDYSLSS